MDLSVVIPAYNEERRLPSTLAHVTTYLAQQKYTSEVIVVDDGSTDGTRGMLRRLGRMPVPVRMISHPDNRNRGKGAAVRRGMLAAGGRWRLFMDADNSTTVDEVARALPWISEGYEIVIGSRKAKGATISTRQPWYRTVAGQAGNIFIRAMVVPGIRDTQAGFKLFTAASVMDIFPLLTLDGWAFDIEILALALKRGYLIKELPISWRDAPDSKIRAGAYLEVVRDVIRVRSILRRQGQGDEASVRAASSK